MKKEIKWLSTIWKVILGAHLVSLIFMSSSNVNIRFMMIIPLWIRYYILIIVHANMISKIGYKKSIYVTITSLLLFMLYSFFINSLSSIRYNSSIIRQIKPSILESFYYYLIPSIIGLIIAIASPKNK
jgi:hypothetical protein